MSPLSFGEAQKNTLRIIGVPLLHSWCRFGAAVSTAKL
jgi:hypothetical protein